MSIKIENLTHIYGANSPFEFNALDDVSATIKEGSFTAIIGHTGSGKSTLIQHLNALLWPTTGQININDFHITNDKKSVLVKNLRQKVGLVFQFPEYQLFEATIQKDLIFGPTNFGVDEKEAIKRAKEIIKLVGLDESYLEKSPFDLSGGQKRRIAIAGILIMNPDILVLDEPTAGLDPKGARDMMNLFKQLNKNGKTVIIVTHDMNHVLEYCDEAIVMKHGKIEKHLSVDELFKQNDYLDHLGIDLPIITDFITKLNKHGYEIDSSIKDIEILAKKIRGEING